MLGLLKSALSSEPKASLGFPQYIRDACAGASFHWRSRILDRIALGFSADPAGAMLRIVNDLSTSRTTISRQCRKFLKGRDPRSIFQQVADRILPYTDGYQSLLAHLDESIKSSSILEYQAGSANLTLFLKLRDSRRKVWFLERDALLRMYSETKLKSLAVDHGLPSGKVGAIILPFLASQKSFESISPILSQCLSLGGTAYSISFSPKLRNEEKLKKWLLDVGAEALANGAPLTSFDFALFSSLLLSHRKSWVIRTKGSSLSFGGGLTLSELKR